MGTDIPVLGDDEVLELQSSNTITIGSPFTITLYIRGTQKSDTFHLYADNTLIASYDTYFTHEHVVYGYTNTKINITCKGFKNGKPITEDTKEITINTTEESLSSLIYNTYQHFKKLLEDYGADTSASEGLATLLKTVEEEF